MTYKIAFCGTIETGKTTLFQQLIDEIKNQGKSQKNTFPTVGVYDQYLKNIVSNANELDLMFQFTEQYLEKSKNLQYIQGSTPTPYDFHISENSLLELIAYCKTNVVSKDFLKVFEKLVFSSLTNYWDLIIYLPIKTTVQKKSNEIMLDYRKAVDSELQRLLKELKKLGNQTQILTLDTAGFTLESAEIKQFLINQKKLS